MVARKKKRGRKHPGVVLIKPNAERWIGWRARWKDPDSGRHKYKSLDAECANAEQRTAWAVDKADEVAKRRDAIKAGAPRAHGNAMRTTLERYFTAHPQHRARTIKIYRTAANKLIAWADKKGLASSDDLTRAGLLDFRASLISEKKRVPLAGKERGTYAATGEMRSPLAVNQDLRSIRTVLGYLSDEDQLPRVSHDDLRRALKRLTVTTRRVEYLDQPALRSLLAACIRHDAETYEATREEHAGVGTRGTTPRYSPVAPLIAGVLLTGMRIGEALNLRWSQVDLNSALIKLSGDDTKTKRHRDVDLNVSPALKRMLAARKLASGGKGPVFGLSRGTAEAAAKRLRAEYGAPDSFTWQTLRRTCGTFLTCAPGIFGASASRSAQQLGHSVIIAERAYVGVLRTVSKTAETLDAAMEIDAELARIAPSAPKVLHVASAEQ